MSQPRGIFIVFEGIDRSGKTTQAKKLNDLINGENECKSVYVRYPNRDTPIGNLIDAYLTKKIELDTRTAHLLFAANRSETMEEIKTHLNKGIHVICDRYVDSGVAYSVAQGLDRDWCYSVDSNLIQPDQVIYLKSDLATSKSRADFGKELLETDSIQVKASQFYDTIASKKNWNVIDATYDVDRVHSYVVSCFKFTRELRGDTKISYISSKSG